MRQTKQDAMSDFQLEAIDYLDDEFTEEPKAETAAPATPKTPPAKRQSVVLKEDVELDFRTKEAYKTLRANLEFVGDDVKVIAVTSCTPNEGKSSVSMNLAKAIAESGKKVILIDADLRKSVLVGRYKTGAVRCGLTHFLSGQKSFQEICCSTNVRNLYIAFAGPVPPNPSELLGGKYFSVAIQKLRDVFDYVIVDTPPLGSVIDSAIVSKQCDGSIMVVACNEISYRFAQRVKAQLEKAEGRILGCVLNKVPINKKGYYSKYYDKYYGDYYYGGNYYGTKSSKGY